MNRERLDGWCERGILALVLAALVFGPVAMGAVGVWQFLVLEGLTLGVLVLWALRIWVSPASRNQASTSAGVCDQANVGESPSKSESTRSQNGRFRPGVEPGIR